MGRALEAACAAQGPVAEWASAAARATASPHDETRPIAPLALPERTPVLRLAAAQAAVAAIAVHLVSAGGVRSAPPPPPVAVVPAPSPAPPPATPSPVVVVAARPAPPPPAPGPTPVPTPLATAAAPLPSLPASLSPPEPLGADVDASRVYDEDEVDEKPRRVAGLSAAYPEWGPKLAKGRRVSITASFVVTEEGLVTDIQVERGGGVLEAVLPEISRWRYEPGRIHGVPVKVRVLWKHTFIGG
jgi:hypothetical protein